jgi:mono/diheme cytochrome c family protein
MKSSIAKLVSSIAIPVLVSVFALGARAQVQFPDAEGRDTLLLVCSQCHSLNRITRATLTADDWEFILYDMIARGAPVHEDDVAALKKYLQDNFATDRR